MQGRFIFTKRIFQEFSVNKIANVNDHAKKLVSSLIK